MQGQPDRIEQFKADIAELKIADPSTSRDHLAARLGRRRAWSSGSASASTPTRCPTAPTPTTRPRSSATPSSLALIGVTRRRRRRRALPEGRPGGLPALLARP